MGAPTSQMREIDKELQKAIGEPTEPERAQKSMSRTITARRIDCSKFQAIIALDTVGNRIRTWYSVARERISSRSLTLAEK